MEYFRSALLEGAGFVVHGYTKRSGGVSVGPFASANFAHDVGDDPVHVAENLERLKRSLNTVAPLARVKQVHGNRIVAASEIASDEWSEPPRAEADGISSAGRDVMIAVQNADCAPVLLADPLSGAVAAIHAGWKGTARGVIRNGVRAMVDLGASPASILAAIGPCACGKCYEVGEEVARHFPESADPVRKNPGKFMLDLGLAVEVSLLGAGLLGRNIDRIPACSICSEDNPFSLRRDGAPSGRFLGFILGRSHSEPDG